MCTPKKLRCGGQAFWSILCSMAPRCCQTKNASTTTTIRMITRAISAVRNTASRMPTITSTAVTPMPSPVRLDEPSARAAMGPDDSLKTMTSEGDRAPGAQGGSASQQSSGVLGAPPAVPDGGVRIVALGGIKEIGRNMTMFEYAGRLLVVDCGMLLGKTNSPGVDITLPDWSAFASRLDQIDAVVLTHGHEDHIGALPYLLRDRHDIPVIGSRLTLGLASAKLDQHRLESDLRVVAEGERISVG